MKTLLFTKFILLACLVIGCSNQDERVESLTVSNTALPELPSMQSSEPKATVEPSATIEPSAKIAPTATVEPSATVEPNVSPILEDVSAKNEITTPKKSPKVTSGPLIIATPQPTDLPIATDEPSPTAPVIVSSDPSLDAEKLYKANCISCHGNLLEGGRGPNLTRVGSSMNESEILSQILEGGGGMPSFEKRLNGKEIEILAAWLARNI
jgi:hypothetical protein